MFEDLKICSKLSEVLDILENLNDDEEEQDKEIKLTFTFEDKHHLFSVLHLIIGGCIEIMEKTDGDLMAVGGGLHLICSIIEQIPDDLMEQYIKDAAIDNELAEMLLNMAKMRQLFKLAKED